MLPREEELDGTTTTWPGLWGTALNAIMMLPDDPCQLSPRIKLCASESRSG